MSQQPETSGKPNPRPLVVSQFGPAADQPLADSLKKQIPAWVISGAVHVVMIALMVLFFSSAPPKVAADDNRILETAIEEAEEPDKNLTNPDLGFDAELEAATDSKNEQVENVEAPDMPDEPIGIASEVEEIPVQTLAPPGLGVGVDNGAPGDNGTVHTGNGGAGGQIFTPGMKGRTGATKDRLLAAGGGNSESEAAVARGLIWLAAQQKSDGRWVFDGSRDDEIEAATGISLLPFLAAGQTHKVGKYMPTVQKGLTWLIGKQGTDGRLGNRSMYSHAIATIALCEAYGMSQDPIVKKAAQKAIDWCSKSQHSAGGWRYNPGMAGDTSVTGWYYQALVSGKLAGLTIPDATMNKAKAFFDSVQGDSGATYGYVEKGGGGRHFSMNAVGLLCREYMGWGPRNPAIANGVAKLITGHPPSMADFDMYYYYYATQVVHFYGGLEWHQKWNPPMRDMLVKLQIKTPGPTRGSWDEDRTITGSQGGRLITTCLCLLTLEVYYRHLPLYKRDNGGLNDLDR